MLKNYFILILFFTSGFLQAQINTKEALALQYIEQKEYEKANLYLEDLFDKNPGIWYSHYFNCLLKVKEFDKAEKITKKQIKNNKNDVTYYVQLGKIYNATGDKKKETESYDKALKEMNPYPPFLTAIVQAFVEVKEYNRAIDAYNKGRKATPDYPYYYERAEIYKMQGNIQAMVNEYLDAIEFRETELYMAQNNLQNSLGYDDENSGLKNPILKQELQKRIQAQPDKTVFAEFLIFILKQQKEFDAAFVQSRALDKRNKEDGRRIYELAKMCVSNRAWEPAVRCYQYLVDKSDSPYSATASIEILSVEYEMVIDKPNASLVELQAVEKKLLEASAKHSGTYMQTFIAKNLATLQAYYLNKQTEAIELLENVINNPGLKPAEKAEYKLLQGDIYLLIGEIWEASLLYSQVEKDFKFETIGHEAKFKNAKLSFYAGDFKWSKAQCDVLKGATTKLIANDALELSLVISDAIGIDTNDLPLKMFSSADLMILQHRYSDAVNRMDSINSIFSNNTLGDDIYFKKAFIYEKTGNYAEAEKSYKNILEFYPTDLYADDAQFKLAELYQFKLSNLEKAKEGYENLITNFPGSIYVVESRKRFRELRGDILKQ